MDSLDLNRVLSILPLSAVMESIWKRLNDEERRHLRAANSHLRTHSDACVTSTSVQLIPGQTNGDEAMARTQVAKFRHLRFLTVKCEHKDMGLFTNRTLLKMLMTSPRLQFTYKKLTTLTIAGSRFLFDNLHNPQANIIPIPPLPSSFSISLKRLHLNSVEIEAGSLACLSSSSSLTSVDLKLCSFRAPSAVKELGNLNSIKQMKMDTCSMNGFPLDMMQLTHRLKALERLELTHIDDMCGGLDWRTSLGAVIGQLTSLVLIRLDAGEYGTVMETEHLADEGAHRSFNSGLASMVTATQLESFAADFLMKDDGWVAVSKLPKLRDLIVEGVVLSRPMPGALESVEDLTMNKATPNQMSRFLPLPALRRLHILFINCSAESSEDLASIEADLFTACRLLRDGAADRRNRRPSSAAAALTSQDATVGPRDDAKQPHLEAERPLGADRLPPVRENARLGDQGDPGLEIVAGFRLVCHTIAQEDNELFSHGKQIGAGAFCRSLRPLDSILKTLYLQNMFISKRDLLDLTRSLPHLHDLCFVTCCMEPMALQCLHPLDLSLRRLSLLYGCSVVPHAHLTAAQTVAYCVSAASSRHLAISSNNTEVSPTLNLEMSLDNMSPFDQQEVKRCLIPYAELLSRGRFKFIFMQDHDLIMQAAFQGVGVGGLNLMMQGLPNMGAEIDEDLVEAWDEGLEEEEEDFVVV